MRIGDLLEMRGVWRGEGREERGLGGFGRFGEGGGGVEGLRLQGFGWASLGSTVLGGETGVYRCL